LSFGEKVDKYSDLYVECVDSIFDDDLLTPEEQKRGIIPVRGRRVKRCPRLDELDEDE